MEADSCALFRTFKMSQAGGGEKKVNIEINIQHQQKRLRKSLKPPGKKKKVFPAW